MSQDPNATPTPRQDSDPTPSGHATRRGLSPVVRGALVVAAAGLGLLLLWSLVGEELYEQVNEYRLAIEDRDQSAPVGYVGLNYRKEYNSRPPQFLFEEDDETRLLWASVGDGETPEFYDVTEARFDPNRLQGGFGRDSIPGVDYPIIEPADGEIAGNLGRSSEVVGMVLGSGPRAYPLGALTKVEVVNDVDGEVPIAVVYARGPDWVRVYRREVDGEPLTFGTTGYATDTKVPLFYDRRTKGLWLPDEDGAALTCVNGEHVGTTLPEYGAPERLSWREWRGKYPETDVLIGNDRSKPIPEG